MLKTVAINIRCVPESVRNRFKAICADKGSTMQDELLDLILEKIKKERKNDERRTD